MAANGHSQNGGRTILVLYRVTNSDSDSADPLFNCFQMPYGRGPTLNAVKQHCTAAHSLSHLGPEGYHWRVLVEDKPTASSGGAGPERAYSWWDIQDGNAKLPVKETTQYNLRKLLYPPKSASSSTDSAAKAAKGAFKMMNKMATAAMGEMDGGGDHGPPVAVLTFKLLDLMKAADDINTRNGGVSAPVAQHHAPRPRAQPRAAPPAPAAQHHHHGAPPQQRHTSAPARSYQAPRAAPQPQHKAPAEGNLMDFGGSPARSSNPKTLHHTHSSPLPTMQQRAAAVNPNESRVEKLKRERTEREQKTAKNRVWDPVDERWVEMTPGHAPPGHKMSGMDNQAKSKVVGIRLDGSGAIGKSASVQQAVAKRMADLEAESNKKVNELREREARRKSDEEQEDVIRRQLEPKIKAWAEEHGQKKQLRALLASLHTILWPGAKWKQLTIGDLLDDGKVKRGFHKASLVVHPDKTHDLPPDQRFLAKRIFDNICQAKTEFDNGTK